MGGPEQARVFPGAIADTGSGTRARLSLSFLSVAQEGKGLARCVCASQCPNLYEALGHMQWSEPW
jgi:hypothetical protein